MKDIVMFLALAGFFTLSGYQLGKNQARLDILESPNLSIQESLKCHEQTK